jgi:hypothetical protein
MSLNTNGWDYIYTLNVNKLNYPIVSGSNSDAINRPSWVALVVCNR